MKTRIAFLFIIVVVTLQLAAAGAAPPPILAIQPGAVVTTPVGQCTLNFVWTGGGNTYIGTAGHCANVGQRASTTGVGAFGTVVFDEGGATDFALIRVDADKVGQVSPAVRQWGGPTGTASTATAKTGDVLLLYGFGLGFSLTALTRPREGVLLSYTGSLYRADTGAVNGDSGAPILDFQDGRAIGIVSHFALPLATDEGATVELINARLAANGFNVALQTATFAPLPV